MTLGNRRLASEGNRMPSIPKMSSARIKSTKTSVPTFTWHHLSVFSFFLIFSYFIILFLPVDCDALHWTAHQSAETLDTLSTLPTLSPSNPIVASFSLLEPGQSAHHHLPPPLHSLNRRQTNFSHLLFDPVHLHLYVGGTNYVLQFDQKLTLLRRLRTGPLLDSAHCSPTDCSGIDSKDIRLSNNYNKALLLDSSGSHLISCGSAKQGACFRWTLNEQPVTRPASHSPPQELAVSEQMLIKVPVAANDENSSTVAFIGPAHYDQPASNVLYVAVTNTKLGKNKFSLIKWRNEQKLRDDSHGISIVTLINPNRQLPWTCACH